MLVALYIISKYVYQLIHKPIQSSNVENRPIQQIHVHIHENSPYLAERDERLITFDKKSVGKKEKK